MKRWLAVLCICVLLCCSFTNVVASEDNISSEVTDVVNESVEEEIPVEELAEVPTPETEVLEEEIDLPAEEESINLLIENEETNPTATDEKETDPPTEDEVTNTDLIEKVEIPTKESDLIEDAINPPEIEEFSEDEETVKPSVDNSTADVITPEDSVSSTDEVPEVEVKNELEESIIETHSDDVISAADFKNYCRVEFDQESRVYGQDVNLTLSYGYKHSASKLYFTLYYRGGKKGNFRSSISWQMQGTATDDPNVFIYEGQRSIIAEGDIFNDTISSTESTLEISVRVGTYPNQVPKIAVQGMGVIPLELPVKATIRDLIFNADTKEFTATLKLNNICHDPISPSLRFDYDKSIIKDIQISTSIDGSYQSSNPYKFSKVQPGWYSIVYLKILLQDGIDKVDTVIKLYSDNRELSDTIKVLSDTTINKYDYTVTYKYVHGNGAFDTVTETGKAELGTKIPYTQEESVKYTRPDKTIQTYDLDYIKNADAIITDDPALNVITVVYHERWYTVIYTDGVPGVIVFPDLGDETCVVGDPTPTFTDLAKLHGVDCDENGNPVRDGYEFKGWTPSINPVIVSNDAAYDNGSYVITYTATWQKVDKPEDKSVDYKVIYHYMSEDVEDYTRQETGSDKIGAFIPYTTDTCYTYEEESGFVYDFDHVDVELKRITSNSNDNVLNVYFQHVPVGRLRLITLWDNVCVEEHEIRGPIGDHINKLYEVGDTVADDAWEGEVVYIDDTNKTLTWDARSNIVNVYLNRDNVYGYNVVYVYTNLYNTVHKVEESGKADLDTLIPYDETRTECNGENYTFTHIDGDLKVESKFPYSTLYVYFVQKPAVPTEYAYKVIYHYLFNDVEEYTREETGTGDVGDVIPYITEQFIKNLLLYKYVKVDVEGKVISADDENILNVYYERYILNPPIVPEIPNPIDPPVVPDHPNPIIPPKPINPPKEEDKPHHKDEETESTEEENNSESKEEDNKSETREEERKSKDTKVTTTEELVKIPDEAVPLANPQTGDDIGQIAANAVMSGIALILALFITISNKRNNIRR